MSEMTENEEIKETIKNEVAKAIYQTHWREPSPTWENADTEVREWVSKQAENALMVVDPYMDIYNFPFLPRRESATS
jgi:hypothetical protein